MEGQTQPPEDQAEEPVLKKQRTDGCGILSDYIFTLSLSVSRKLGDYGAHGAETEVQA